MHSGRTPSTDGKSGRAQPRRGVLVLKLESEIKDLLFVKGGEQEKPLLGFVKMKHESAGRNKARQLQITVRRARTTWGSASTEPRRIKMFYI